MHMARYEDLIARQPVLISDVLLRQNPHNVHEWHKRISLFTEDPQRTVEEYTQALKTVNPEKATGKPHTLWVSFGKFWEENEELEHARKVFEKAVLQNFKTTEHLTSLWCEYVEMELRGSHFDRALSLVQRATLPPPNPHREIPKTAPVQKKLFKSVRYVMSIIYMVMCCLLNGCSIFIVVLLSLYGSVFF